MRDAVTGHKGNLVNVRFTDGVAGQAFLFAPDDFPPGTRSGEDIADQAAYALTKSLTV
jgi:hypothetical protein